MQTLITIDKLEELDACAEGVNWFCKNYTHEERKEGIDLLKLLADLKNDDCLEWSNWLLPRLFKDVKNCVRYALYTKKWTLPIWDKIYPDDSRPHKAYDVAQAWLNNPCEKTANAAANAVVYVNYANHTAAYADYAAANAAASANADNAYYTAADAAAANAAYAVDNATNAYAAAVNTANAAYASNSVNGAANVYKEMIGYGLELLKSEQNEEK